MELDPLSSREPAQSQKAPTPIGSLGTGKLPCQQRQFSYRAEEGLPRTFDTVKSLIIGYGSIGMRHARVLEEMGHDVAVLSRRADVYRRQFGTLAGALSEFDPEYVVVANETSMHVATLLELHEQGFGGPTLVEKPLMATKSESGPANGAAVFVGYNLRFHPLLQLLRTMLESESFISLEIRAGQYLPNWRPGTDYRRGYSADRSRGGGVLRDLSHELDYVSWIAGPWIRLTALGGSYSGLDIDSDDTFALLMTTERSPIVTVSLNYLDRTTRREVLVNVEGGSYHLDLVRNRLTAQTESGDFDEERTVGRDDTYIAQHEAVLSGKTDTVCSLAEGFEVMDTIAAAERAARTDTWVER